MKLTLTEIKGFLNAYQNMARQSVEINLAYRLSKMKVKMQDDGAFFDSQMSAIIDKYAEKDENGKPVYMNDGNTIKILPDKLTECKEELNKLNNMQVEVEDFEPLTLKDLSYFRMSLTDMESLIPFIKEEEKTE